MSIEAEFEQMKRELRQLQDRQAIRDCIVRECRGRDRQDVELIASCWWPDGIDEHGPVLNRAPDYPERANKGHQMFFRMTSHNITNHLCELDGDTAHCESYVVGGLAWLDGKTTTLAFGRYLDRLERRQGEWRLLARRCTIEMTADADSKWLYSDAIKGFLQGLWSRDDPSYERPFVAKPKTEGVRW